MAKCSSTCANFLLLIFTSFVNKINVLLIFFCTILSNFFLLLTKIWSSQNKLLLESLDMVLQESTGRGVICCAQMDQNRPWPKDLFLRSRPDLLVALTSKIQRTPCHAQVAGVGVISGSKYSVGMRPSNCQ